MTCKATQYTHRELTKNIGIYFSPPLIFPFSIIETINEDPIAVIPIAQKEKGNTNIEGSIDEFEKSNGNGLSTLPKLAPSNAVMEEITFNNAYDNPNKTGDITTTIAEIKII